MLCSAYSTGTLSNLRTQLKFYLLFCTYFHFTQMPARLDTICFYVRFLSHTLSPPTICNYLLTFNYTCQFLVHLPLLQLSGHSVLSLHINIKFILCLLVLSPPYSFCLGIPVLLFLLKTALLLRFIRAFLLLVFLILGLSRSFFPSRCSLLSIL